MDNNTVRGTHDKFDVIDVDEKYIGGLRIRGLKDKLKQFKTINPYNIMILGGLQPKQTYGGKHRGGFKSKTIQKRRAANRIARRQRKLNAHS